MDTLLSQHKGKMTTDDLFVLLTAKVNEAAKHGQSCLAGVLLKLPCPSFHLSRFVLSPDFVCFCFLPGWYYLNN